MYFDSFPQFSLITKRAEAEKASWNIIKAIEMGIITERTKHRLTELKRQINQLDFDIDREKQRFCVAFLLRTIFNADEKLRLTKSAPCRLCEKTKKFFSCAGNKSVLYCLGKYFCLNRAEVLC